MMLVLSCIPCRDADTIATGNNFTTATSIKTDAHHSSHSEHNDLCSPFCVCSCCSVAFTVLTPVVMEISFLPVISERVFGNYKDQRPVGIAQSVWQPPRLV